MESQKLTPVPLPGRVLVRQVEPVQKSKLVHLLEEEWPPIATVLAVGTGVHDVAVGDRVLFIRRASTALVQDDRFPDQHEEWKNLIMLREDDIAGIIEED